MAKLPKTHMVQNEVARNKSFEQSARHWRASGSPSDKTKGAAGAPHNIAKMLHEHKLAEHAAVSIFSTHKDK